MKKPEHILSGLVDIAERLGLCVRYERLFYEEIDVRSGRCRINGRQVLLIDKKLPVEQKIEILSRELRAMNLDEIYIKPWFRSFLGSEEQAEERSNSPGQNE